MGVKSPYYLLGIWSQNKTQPQGWGGEIAWTLNPSSVDLKPTTQQATLAPCMLDR